MGGARSGLCNDNVVKVSELMVMSRSCLAFWKRNTPYMASGLAEFAMEAQAELYCINSKTTTTIT